MELELAYIAIIISAVVLLLQVLSLALIAGMQKSLRNLKEARPTSMPPAERFERKNADFRRHEKRPYQDQKPQPAAAAGTPIDPVEKSLRDINLRLKSAERDQEFARRKIQENFSSGDHPRNRDDRDHRGNRDRDHHHRNHRRDNWQDRNRPGAPQQQQPASTVPSQPGGEQTVEKKAFSPLPPELQVQAPVQPAVPATGQDLGATDYGSDENLQHGRKIIVKRRMLKDELPEDSKAEATTVEGTPVRPVEAPAPQAAESPEEETRMSTGPTPENEIRFGRR